jgi:hypothetical protein
MARVVDTVGNTVAGGVWITLRADAPGGVSLGGADSIEPGETRQVPASIALSLLNSQRAWRAAPAKVEERGAGDGVPPAAKGKKK